MKSIKKKIFAIMLLIITILSSIQPIFAVTIITSGTAKWVAGQYDSDIYTTDSQGSVGMIIRRLTNNSTGEKVTTFCAEYGVDISTGTIHTGTHSVPTDALLQKACKVAYFGWYSRYGDYAVDGGILAADMIWVREHYVFTQQLVWETLGQSYATFKDADVQSRYLAFKTEIEQKMATMELQPSFTESTITLDVGTTTTLTDSYGVLSSYTSIDRTVNGIRIQHNYGENTMNVTVSEDCSIESYVFTIQEMESYGLIKEETRNHDTTVYITFKAGVQNQLYAMNYNDPVSMSLSLQINSFGNLELSKLNTDGDLIDGAVFEVKGPNNFSQDVTVTGGKITLSKLRKGSYTVKEKSAPNGYLLNTNIYTVEVYSNQTATQAIINDKPTGTFTLTKKNEDGSKKLAGVKYRVWNEDGTYNQIHTTSSLGTIVIQGLKLGKHSYQEVETIAPYLLDEAVYSFELNYKDQNTKVIHATAERTNKEPTGTFTLVKKNSDGKATLEGTKYRIWNNSGYDKEFTTDKNGKIVVTGLKLGNYNYQEVQAIEGYLLDTNTYTFDLTYEDQYTSVVYANAERKNEEPTGTISIVKKDSETGSTPQGDAILENAKYEVYANDDIYNKAKTKKFYSKGDLVATRTMNTEGTTADVTGLPLGKYLVKEVVASKGYLIDKTEYQVNLEYKDQNTKIISATVTSYEKVKKMQVHIFKSGIKENSGLVSGLEGAEFTIKLNKDVENAYSQGYSYAEVWNGIDEYGNTVTVDKSRVTEAQKIAPTYDAVTTDKDGNAYTQNNLPYGKYIVKETKTPKDFESAADFTFSITEDESEINEVAQKVKHLVVNNEQLETYLKIIKKDLTTDKTVTLSSSTFQIKATKDIYDRGTGKIIYKKGEVIKQKVGNTTYDTFTTNADNIVVPDGSYNSNNDDKGSVITPLLLPVGSYEVSEIRVPEGFLQLESPVSFKIEGIKDYDKDQDGDYIKEVIVKNEQPTGTLIIDKYIALREEIDTSLIDTSDLSGIEFTLIAKENIIDMADGSIIYEKGKEIKKVNLNKEGSVQIDNLPIGNYELYESRSVNGLVTNNTRYEVKFEQKDLITKVYENTVDVINDTTIVEFSKQSITGDTELIGAKLTVIDENGNIIDTWISTENTHKIEGLVVGKTYTLKEEIAPEGFVKATDVKFTVLSTTEIQKVQMVDKIVEMTKSDIGGEEIEGAKIIVYDKVQNVIDEWISTKEPHRINNLIEGETYILHEEIAPDGYVKATDIEFKVTTEKKIQQLTMLDKVVEMSKQDIGGNEIEGAELKVYDKNGEIVDEWVSGTEPHKIKNLVEGQTYILHEEYAPDGFTIATDMEFTVGLEKENQKIFMVDKVVEMTKVDIGGEEIEGATIVVTNKRTKNIVDKWVSEKVPHKIKGLIEGETYILHEEIAVDGYVKATDIEFTVSEEKQTQKIELVDKVVLISKTDLVTGEELPGAKLVVTDKDGNVVDEWLSTNEPHHVSGLEEGKEYTLTEITSPYGYEIAESIKFKVTEEKETQLIEMKDMPILNTIKILKIDSETKEAIKAKFSFGIYEDVQCTKLIKEVKSNKDEGTVTFEDLRYGIYYIKEIKAPKGYTLSNKVVKIEINENGVFADEEILEKQESAYSFTYYNEQIPKVQTGNEMNYILLFSSMVISLAGIIAGIIILIKDKQKNR